MKKENCGNEKLFKKSEWIDKKFIQGDDALVLKSPLMETAFRKILSLFTPKHKIALVSLCTSSRPYSKSRKWKTYKELFGKHCDLIVCSNGGIIPEEFWESYPYLTYDAHGQKKFDKMYIYIIYKRLMEFFAKNHYEKIIFNFRPNLRNRISAQQFVKNNGGGMAKVYILPTVHAFRNAIKRGNVGPFRYYPDLDVDNLKEIEQAINE